jgi:bile acid-coenzyme A ligase
VESAVVIGLPDEDLGARAHAIVKLPDPGQTHVSDTELRAFLGACLARYKIPRSFEFVDEPLRDRAGKVRRAELREDRLAFPGDRSTQAL